MAVALVAGMMLSSCGDDRSPTGASCDLPESATIDCDSLDSPSCSAIDDRSTECRHRVCALHRGEGPYCTEECNHGPASDHCPPGFSCTDFGYALAHTGEPAGPWVCIRE